jgi:anaerobic selenocysteine-containing dehydrogenase
LGLTRYAMEAAALVHARAKAVLLLLRGNIGRPGAGICPVRGHSNMQGQRTVGISEKPELVPLDRLAEQYGLNRRATRG